MNLKEYLDFACEDCIDTYDDKFDIDVTVNQVTADWENDGYKRFNEFVNENVEVLRGSHGSVICGWTQFVEDNKPALKKYMEEQWLDEYQYSDFNDFAYAWLQQIHLYLSGDYSQSECDELLGYLNEGNSLNKLADNQKNIESKGQSGNQISDDKIRKLFMEAANEYQIDPDVSKKIVDNVMAGLKKEKEKGEGR